MMLDMKENKSIVGTVTDTCFQIDLEVSQVSDYVFKSLQYGYYESTLEPLSVKLTNRYKRVLLLRLIQVWEKYM